MKIGSLSLDNITILAPLAGITHLPFRLLAKREGCGLVCSEMISANGLVRNGKKTVQLMESLPEEKPLSVQIFGNDPAVMADAAQIAEASGADILDINLGCPVRKVLKTGSGAALMKDPERVKGLLRAVRASITIPLSIKIRTGWDPTGNQAIAIAKIAEDCGVDAIAVHPRTAPQGFGGRADWSIIASVKETVTIPVVGSGDIKAPQDALKMKTETGCDGVMIGRASIGNPWIFSQILAHFRGDKVPPVSLADRFTAMIGYLETSIRCFGEPRACAMMRSRLGWFTKTLPFSSKFRESIKQISSEDEAKSIIVAYWDSLENVLGEDRRGTPL
ncbi:MAG: tRNA dihydrouridine synthase DusB [Desulfobacterales bacterium]